MSQYIRAWEALSPKIWEAGGMNGGEIYQALEESGIHLFENREHNFLDWAVDVMGLVDYDEKQNIYFPKIQGEYDTGFVWEPFPNGIKSPAQFVVFRDKLNAWREGAKKISHKRARALLYRMPLERDFSVMGPQYLGAVAHYLKCQECRSLGLAKIRQTGGLKHKNALLIWAKNGSYLPKEKPRNLFEVYAVEHVLACKAMPCSTLKSYWDNYIRKGLEKHEDEAKIHLYPVLIGIFMRAKWQTGELFSLQRERIKALLKDLKEHQRDEVIAQLDTLQSVAKLPRVLPLPERKPKKPEEPKKPKVDLLAEATGGKLHWNDKGMDDWEKGWQPFTRGTRVEVRVQEDTLPPYGRWLKGTVAEEFLDSERAIVVKCDERWHEDMRNYRGHGATIMVMHNTRRGILARIRKIEGE